MWPSELKYDKPIQISFIFEPFLLFCWVYAAAAAAKSLQSCPTLCDPRDRSPPGSPVPGILQARTLEWVAISFSNAWRWKENVKSLSHVWLLATPWTAAYQAPLSMGFSRQEYWSGVPLPSLGNLHRAPVLAYVCILFLVCLILIFYSYFLWLWCLFFLYLYLFLSVLCK